MGVIARCSWVGTGVIVDRLAVAVLLTVIVAGMWFTPLAPRLRRSLAGPPSERPEDEPATEPLWKRGLLILAGLYPLVVLHGVLFSEHIERLGQPVALLLGTVVTVGVLGWPILPLLRRAMRWWLRPDGATSAATDVLGAVALLAVIALTVAAFQVGR